jgi:hypothetical protein
LFIHFYYQLGLFGYFVVNALTVELTMYMHSTRQTNIERGVQCTNDQISYVYIYETFDVENESEKESDSAVDNEFGSKSECEK